MGLNLYRVIVEHEVLALAENKREAERLAVRNARQDGHVPNVRASIIADVNDIPDDWDGCGVYHSGTEFIDASAAFEISEKTRAADAASKAEAAVAS